MADLMDNNYVKSKAPVYIIAFCASFMMLIQTIASGLAVVGYDDVIRADAKAREAKILQGSKPSQALELKVIELERNQKTLKEEVEQLKTDNLNLKLLAHEAG